MKNKKALLFLVAVFSFVVGLVLNDKKSAAFSFLESEKANADATVSDSGMDACLACGSGEGSGGSGAGCSGA